jgi:hypothetical protein
MASAWGSPILEAGCQELIAGELKIRELLYFRCLFLKEFLDMQYFYTQSTSIVKKRIYKR